LACGGEDLAGQISMLFLSASIKGRQGRLEINGRNRFARFPKGLEAGKHRMGPGHLGIPALDP